MSFQHFRLGEVIHQPLPPHLQGTISSIPSVSQNAIQHFPGQTVPTNNTFPPDDSTDGHTPTKPPYGSGDADDGYTLVFPNIEAFHDWRNREEELQMVEFVKGDTHGSKAVPPRFKDHTKLVCARHSRSGRKKYVKKHPDRVRKVPSRKLEGEGCPASISYKTYFDTDEVRACYISQHSHEIGLANLPYTRRGRKAAVQQEKSRKHAKPANDGAPVVGPSSSTNINAVASTSSAQPQFSSAVSMLAPLPTQPPYQTAPQQFGYQAPPAPAPTHNSLSHDRWENMTTLFNSVREHARSFEYPTVSVAALETVLIRLYLESPVGLGAQPSMPTVMQGGIAHPAPQSTHQLSNQAQNIQTRHESAGSADGTGDEDDS